MSELPRRRLLAVTGAGLTGAIAGCSSSDDDESEEPDDEGDSDPDPGEGETGSSTELEGTILGDITIDNLDDATHAVDVLVEFDREIEHWVTEEPEADSSVTLERNWSSDPGAFRVTARLDGGELVQVTPAKLNDPDCVNLYVRVDRDGELTYSSNSDRGPCGDASADE